jgi:hypothetical protein
MVSEIRKGKRKKTKKKENTSHPLPLRAKHGNNNIIVPPAQSLFKSYASCAEDTTPYHSP